MKFSISIISDTLFTSLVSFLLFFITVNAFLVMPYSVICSISLSIIFTTFTLRHMLRKRQLLSVKKLDEKAFDDALVQLNLMPKTELINFFYQLLSKNGYLVEKKQGGIFITDKNVYLFFKFGFEVVTKADIVRFFNLKEPNSTCYIISETFSQEVSLFASRFENVNLCDGKRLFSYLKEKDNLPENKYVLSSPRRNFLLTLKSIIDRKKAKVFALYGLIFLFMSYFVLLKVYYLICSAIFFSLSLVCFLFGEKKVNKKD